MTAIPEIPGIIEGAMMITPAPDGRMSFRVLIGADGERVHCCDRIELIVNPEHLQQALAARKGRRLAGARAADELPMFRCHIGFSHNNVNSAP